MSELSPYDQALLAAAALDQVWGGPFRQETYAYLCEWLAATLRATREGRADAQQLEIAEVALSSLATMCLASAGSAGCGPRGVAVPGHSAAADRRRAACDASEQLAERGRDLDDMVALITKAGAALDPGLVAELAGRGEDAPVLLAAVALAQQSAERSLPRRLRTTAPGPLIAVDVVAAIGAWGDTLVGLARGWEEDAQGLADVVCALEPFVPRLG